MHLTLSTLALAFAFVTHTSALTPEQRQTDPTSPRCCLPLNYICDTVPVVGTSARIGCCPPYRCIDPSSNKCLLPAE
ncbi:hypothetical protein B0H14DRAFT_3444960 [Mycena olivaceomarginata]|nr:hypothetical protein B0H14DRAFT_3444960 [Mycena olivaceomarginata]